MASPSQQDEEHLTIDPAEPFKGVIVCCTSIPPEYRVRPINPTHPGPVAGHGSFLY